MNVYKEGPLTVCSQLFSFPFFSPLTVLILPLATLVVFCPGKVRVFQLRATRPIPWLLLRSAWQLPMSQILQWGHETYNHEVYPEYSPLSRWPKRAPSRSGQYTDFAINNLACSISGQSLLSRCIYCYVRITIFFVIGGDTSSFPVQSIVTTISVLVAKVSLLKLPSRNSACDWYCWTHSMTRTQEYYIWHGKHLKPVCMRITVNSE